MVNHLIYWTLLNYKEWKLYIAATKNGLCYVGSQDQSFDEIEKWANKKMSNVTFEENDEKMQTYTNELIEYLEGKRLQFSVPLDFHGTPFQLAVWNELSDIPFGKTKTYSDIANKINKPSAVRAVGTAIGANPLLITIPCHRVIGKNGSLTGYRGGLEMKKSLLQIES